MERIGGWAAMEKWRNERIPVTRDGFPRSVTCRSLPFDALAASYTTFHPDTMRKGGRQSSSPPSLWSRINALFKSTCFFSSSRPLVCPLPPFFPIRGEWFECRGEIGGAKAGGERGLPIPGGRLEVSPCPPANVALCHFFIHSWFCGRLAWRIRKNSSTPRLPLPPSSTEFRPLCRSTDSFALRSLLLFLRCCCCSSFDSTSPLESFFFSMRELSHVRESLMLLHHLYRALFN